MKKQYLPIILIFFASCLGYKELPVEYDYSYKGHFKKYKTFDMLNSGNLEDSTQSNDMIEKMIISRMKFLGYRQVSTKPNLIIGYKIFKDSLKLKGYVQPNIETWMARRGQDEYTEQKFVLNEGTLLIQFYDRRQDLTIWQGYATESYGAIDYNNPRHVKNAVISILNKYSFWADGFLEAALKPQIAE
jgi:hypothetical protein